MSRSASDELRVAAAQASFSGWSLLDASGVDCERFLASQLTSDVHGLAVGRSQLTALLDRSGRLQAFGFLLRAADRFRLLLPEDVIDAAVRHLESHLVADDVILERRQERPRRIALGPAAVRAMSGLPADRVFPIEGWGSRGFVTWQAAPLPFPELTPNELEALRVLTGLPRWGVEAGPGMLVNETTLVDSAVSFTKGCFVGQETVAKVASGRGAARFPVALWLDQNPIDPAPLVGASFTAEDRQTGTVRSWAAWQGATVLQAAVARELRVEGLSIRCHFAGGLVIGARVALLPVLTTPSAVEHAAELHGLAVTAFAEDREDEAVVLLERALAVCPGHADSCESLGVILARHGRLAEAIELMRRLAEVDPTSVMAHTNLSLYLSRLGRIEEAELEGRIAAGKQRERQRRELEAEQAVASAASQRRADLARRERMFREVLDLDPEDALGNFGMGELCVDSGRFEEAVSHLERAIAAHRDYSAAYLALGRAWEGMREPERARRVYAAGVEVAARRGDLAAANRMQQRQLELGAAFQR